MVNVILVDFRGFDTLGEITVLGVVGDRGVLAAAPVPPGAREHRAAAAAARSRAAAGACRGPAGAGGHHARSCSRRSALLAVYLLLRGHNLPGGGFVAGLTLAVGVILQYMAGGTRWAEDRLAIRPVRWIGVGLLLAGATGAGAWLFAHAVPHLAYRAPARCR